MAFPRKLLNDDEDVVLDLNPHWWFMFKQTVALVAAIVLGVIALVSDVNGALKIVAGVLILAALGWWGMRYMAWRTTNFVVTTDRLIYRNGVLSQVAASRSRSTGSTTCCSPRRSSSGCCGPATW